MVIQHLSTHFIKPFLFHSSTDVVAQFLEKLEILFDETFSRFENIDGRNLIHRALNDYF